jgi:hypothetical protein
MWIKRLFNTLIYIFAGLGCILVLGYFAVNFGWTNTPGIIDRQDDFFQKSSQNSPSTSVRNRHISTEQSNINTPTWAEGEEWNVFKEAVIKDKDSIIKAVEQADVSPRLIVAELAVEQLRLYHTNREVFKQFFAPLKLLGNQSQFSWGVMGLKQETAIDIEKNLRDPSSSFYPGKEYEKLLDFKTNNHDKERFERIINEQDRYYSYFYAALYNKQVISQWQKAGYDISERPEILATLFNIGFKHSIPKADPQVGGSAIEINGKLYSFGGLAAEFYNSSELITEFPR